MTQRSLQVIETGPMALIQDRGRVGHLAVGVGRAGAADQASYELGGRLVGNPVGLAAIEVMFGGLRVRAIGDLLVCLTGAEAAATIVDQPDSDREAPYAAPFYLRHGSELALAQPVSGLRSYLSVRGGLVIEPVLSSCARDTMSGLGPNPLQAGDVLPIGDAPPDPPTVDVAPVAAPGGGVVTLRVTRGPRWEWFAEPRDMETIAWAVSDRSDRRGIRLTGGSLRRATAWVGQELPSEGMVRGAIQVPPNGEPVIFLNDHPVTGGYPVIGVVRSADVDLAAQLQPGQAVSFRWEG